VVLLDVVADGDRILGLNTGEADGGRASVCPDPAHKEFGEIGERRS
jgi:hypothetical protein